MWIAGRASRPGTIEILQAVVVPMVKRSLPSSARVSRVHGHISTDSWCTESERGTRKARKTRGTRGSTSSRPPGRLHFAHTWRGRTFTLRGEFSSAVRQAITFVTLETRELLLGGDTLQFLRVRCIQALLIVQRANVAGGGYWCC